MNRAPSSRAAIPVVPLPENGSSTTATLRHMTYVSITRWCALVAGQVVAGRPVTLRRGLTTPWPYAVATGAT
jgi:hypothetical protein